MIKITVLSGFLGSGKTTLLRRLLRHASDLKLGVIVNDMAELEIDGDLVRSGQRVTEEKGTFVSLFAGSISGDQRASFSQILDSWQARIDLEHVIIETSGSTHPWPLLEEISRRSESYVITNFVTLVDAKAFIEDYGSGKLLFEKLIHNEQEQRRSTENLMAEQIQFASTLIVTKTDRVRPDDLPFLLKCLEALNPDADVHAASYGHVTSCRLLGPEKFNLERSRSLGRAWRESASGELGSSAAYDIGSTVFCDPRPFHPGRLWRLFHERLGLGIHRSKGFLWMASREEQVLLWNQAAGSIELELLAYWKAALVKDPLGKLVAAEKSMLREQLAGSHPLFGDRLNELTVIGTLRDRELFMPELQACLCTGEEIAHWSIGGHFDDPWPKKLRKLP